MKRDMDLCREILLHLESTESGLSADRLSKQIGRDEEEIQYHVRRLIEAELLTTIGGGRSGGVHFGEVIELTWQGHEFLDTARNEEHWGKAKEAAGKAGTWGFSVLSAILTNVATQALNAQLGIQ